MPTDEGRNDQSPREHGANGGQHPGRHGRNLRRHGNRGGEHQLDDSPSSRDGNHASKVTYMTGQESEPLSGIYEPHVKSVTTLAS